MLARDADTCATVVATVAPLPILTVETTAIAAAVVLISTSSLRLRKSSAMGAEKNAALIATLLALYQVAVTALAGLPPAKTADVKSESTSSFI